MQRVRNKKGFTLVELLAGMVIMALVMAGVFSIFNSSLKAFQYSQKRMYEVEQARKALLTLTDDLRKATLITVDGSDQVTYAYEDPANPGTDLTFTVAVIGGALLKGSQPLTANIVKSVSFIRDAGDGRILTITLTLNDPENKSSGDYVLTAEVFSPNLLP